VSLPPLLDQHADFATPWDLLELLNAAPGPIDVMVEAKAKDQAVLWLRRQLTRVARDDRADEESLQKFDDTSRREPHAANRPTYGGRTMGSVAKYARVEAPVEQV
jgi:hypothetical protein